MRTLEKLQPARYGKTIVLQSTDIESGKFLGLYFDGENKIIPTEGSWQIIRWSKTSKLILEDIIERITGYGLACEFKNNILSVDC